MGPHRQQPKPHGPILVECRTLRHVVASSAEAEIAAIFMNAKEAVPIKQTLEEIGKDAQTQETLIFEASEKRPRSFLIARQPT